MTTPNTQSAKPPSMRALIYATAAAAAVAAFLLAVVILPAEYGIDPLGTGEALGLLALSGPAPAAEAPPPGATMYKPVQEGPIAHYAAPYQLDTAEFEIGPYEYLEYKYRLEEGADMFYSWTASADVVHDLHGEPDKGEEQSFDTKPRREGNGAYRAPFTGIHGWFWENPGADTITVRIDTVGFYASAVEIRSNRTRHMHELRAIRSPQKSEKTEKE